MNADLQKNQKDPETYAILGAAMEVHLDYKCSVFNLRESVQSAVEMSF